jgi:hypothetical protein
MGCFRHVLVGVLALALGGYGFDCGVAVSADEAMQCCKEMPCSSQGHDSQDCCKNMPSLRTPFLPASSLNAISFSALAFVAMPVVSQPFNLIPIEDLVVTQCHAPPIGSALLQQPLRI